MVGGNTIAQNGKHPSPGDLLNDGNLLGHALEIGWIFDIGAGLIPGVAVTHRNGKAPPSFVAIVHRAILFGKHFPIKGAGFGEGNLRPAWPNIFQEDRLPIRPRADGVLGKIDVDAASQGIGDHQRGRGKVVGADLGMDTTFKIAVARQNRRNHQAALLDTFGNRSGQRAGVAYASGATVADQVEFEFVKRACETCFFKVIGNHLRAGSKAGFDPRLGG